MNDFTFKKFVRGSKNFVVITLFFSLLFLTYACVDPTTGECKCPYKGNNDLAIITLMIKAEAVAANSENMFIIRSIFAPNAHIVNERDGTEWNDPITHYLELFDIFNFTGAKNFDIKEFGKGITSDTAYIKSSNSGIYTMNGGEPITYNNTNPKDTWILKKNKKGCWLITEYRYY